MKRIFVGVDPGIGGGIAAIDSRAHVILAVKMPATELDRFLVFQRLANLRDAINAGDGKGRANPIEIRAMLERVFSSPQMGVASAFTFGKICGQLEMALTAAAIPFDLVLPRKWQAELGAQTKGTIGKRAADKNISKRRAQALFPHHEITHAIAEALLIAEYCRRHFETRRLRQGQ